MRHFCDRLWVRKLAGWSITCSAMGCWRRDNLLRLLCYIRKPSQGVFGVRASHHRAKSRLVPLHLLRFPPYFAHRVRRAKHPSCRVREIRKYCNLGCQFQYLTK
ncbi:hypothetical protein BDV27DRAFT_139063 [Aspergillus caelatus]|uniref:Uncharacterized protein n=1 Tax=Aspergillus caelatus TaxID=61420 RepID=A0A5N6ZN59_9EURO|nr:uncharacterized protein BDV27DRAFT_139063 [Aspergillus caelatus]KAE8357600.1 hypothetical protein BDV27DRAFT_139063 [Aspergillus caelatus]